MLYKEFVPYEQSLALKELGFDEPCFKMSEHKKVCDEQSKPQGCQLHNLHCGYPDCTIDKSITPVPLPTFSQAFRWFRKKYNIDAWVQPFVAQSKKNIPYLPDESYGYFIFKDGVFVCDKVDLLEPEEAELACLIKLIQIVKEKK